MDQGSFLGLRALGYQPCTLLTWTYERPVDLAALTRFNDRLADTLLGRLVQPSPLPGGRHRWVALERSPRIEVEAVPRPRAEIHDWADELADRGVDPEHGPGWRLGVLPLTDGGTAVVMVGSHTLGDGMCKLGAIADAVDGVARRPDYLPRGHRRGGRLLWADLVGFVREVPAVLRAVAAGVRVARAHAGAAGPRQPAAVRPGPTPRELPAAPFHAPAACVRVAQVDWDAAAARLGGTSNTLVSAVAARLGLRFGRVGQDGTVSLAVPVSVRVEGDTSANALDSVVVAVDPGGLTEDLSGLRAATKAALRARAEHAHDLAAVLPLVPLTPPVVARRAEHLAMGSSVSPVGCSNHGQLAPAVTRIDGRDADDFWVRLSEPGRTPAGLDGIGGQLYLLGGRALDVVYVSVLAHPIGGGLDRPALHGLLAETLAEFGLRAARS